MPMNYGHHGSARMAELLHPTSGIREAQIRRGITPRDHAKDNRLKLKEMQLKNKQRREAVAAAAASPKLQSSTKFAAVGSRVAAQLARPASAASLPTHTPELRNFSCPKPCGPAGRVFTAWAPPPLLNEGGADLPRREKRNPPVPLRQPPPPKPPPVDFVKRNTELSSLTPRKAVAAVAAASPGSPPGTGGKSRHHGRLPPYLLDRKLELAQAAEAKANAAKPRECPEGTHVLAEEERQRVLDLVRRGQERMHKELDAMPFVVDTYGLKEKQLQLTRQLQQLDAAEKAFSRTKVIVTDDDEPTASMGGGLPSTAPVADAAAEPIEACAPVAEPAEPEAPAAEAEDAAALEIS